MLWDTCCFTGHRPQRLAFGLTDQESACTALQWRLCAVLEWLARARGVTHFISGMALGVDQMAAELVLSLREEQPCLTLECAVPCPEQSAKWSFEQRRRYDAILRRCDRTTLLQTAYSPDCMAKRNRYMVERSGFVLAVWDGSPGSGTGQTVRYARKRGRQIVTLHPGTLEIDRSGLSPCPDG